MAKTRHDDSLEARIEALEDLCSQAYQFAGSVGAPARVLDALLAGAEGRPIPANFLPVDFTECDEIAEREAQLQEVARVLGARVGGGRAAASVIGRRGGRRTSHAKAAAARANGQKGGRPAKS